MKTSKSEIMKNKILDTAEILFVKKGYAHTTINDILEAGGIVKGSLYYYYKSKEEILDGVIKRHGDQAITAATQVATDVKLNAKEKLLAILLAQKPQDSHQQQLIDDLEGSSDGYMFLKTVTDLLLRLAPILGDIIINGNNEEVFNCPYPQESAEILLAAAHSLFDNANLHWSALELQARIPAFITATERLLGTKDGALIEMLQLFM